MKTFIISAILVATVALGANAQDKSSKADFPTWVIESNVKTPKNSIVKFYNAKQELIYQEAVVGKRININRTKVKEGLNGILKQLTESKAPITNDALVMACLKR